MAPVPGPVEQRSRRPVVASLLALALLGMLLTSAAVFSGATDNPDNLVAIGTLDVASAPVSVAVTGSGLGPGDVVADELDVRNDGSLELRYAVTSTTDETTLASALVFEVRTGVTDCTPAGADADGTLVAGPGPLGTTTGMALIGDPTQGDDAGDRTLAAGASEVLCLRVELPASADEAALADRSSTAVLRLDAEQTGANP